MEHLSKNGIFERKWLHLRTDSKVFKRCEYINKGKQVVELQHCAICDAKSKRGNRKWTKRLSTE